MYLPRLAPWVYFVAGIVIGLVAGVVLGAQIA